VSLDKTGRRRLLLGAGGGALLLGACHQEHETPPRLELVPHDLSRVARHRGRAAELGERFDEREGRVIGEGGLERALAQLHVERCLDALSSFTPNV